MSRVPPEPERWSARATNGATVEDRFGAAFRDAAAATVPTDEVCERVRRRVRPPRAARGRISGGVAAALVLLLSGGGAVWAMRAVLRAVEAPVDSRAPAAVAPAKHARRHAAARALPEVGAAPPAPAVAPPPPAPAVAAAPPADSRAPTRQARVNTSGTPPAPAEAELLATAFRRLRVERDAVAALCALDEHARRFPGGDLGPEAGLARVEALLRLGRQPEALVVLDGLPRHAGGGPSARRHALMRGELRAALGRCAEALGDFDEVLAGQAADADDERGLRGRATCRGRLGDTAGARADLQRYVVRHPDGGFAAEARRQLDAGSLP
jgi:hypothetical protein